MMKYENPQKITALGVVIFSFVAMFSALLITVLFGGLSALLVLKTGVPESFMKIGCVVGSGLGFVFASAFLTAVGKVKGILAAAIIAVSGILVKMLGNAVLNLGGYFTLSGLIGILFVVVFSFSGSIIGSMLKKK